MDLIERYLHAVKTHLPIRQQEDVVAELADDLRSRVDDREAELGRPLKEEEVAAILKSLGRPLLLASRYAGRQMLIGPALLPYFWQTVKVALGIALLVQIVVTTVMLVTGQPPATGLRGLVNFPFVTAPTLVGWITVVFVVLDRNLRLAMADTWDPRTLPAVPRDGQARSRVPIVGDLVGLGLGLAWWLIVPAHPFLLLGPAASFLALGPGWQACVVPVAALMAMAISAHIAALARPAWRLPTRVFAHTLALIGLALLATSGDLLVPVAAIQPPDKLAGIVAWIDRSVGVALGVAALITVIELGRDLWRMAQARRPGVVAARASTPPASPR